MVSVNKSKKLSKTNSSSSGFFNILKLALFSPSELFEKVKGEKDLWPSLKFLSITNVFFALLLSLGLALVFYFLVELLLLSSFAALIPPYFIQSLFFYIFLFAGLFFVFSLIIFIILSFLTAGIFHLFVKLFNGAGNFVDTYKVVAYSQAPLLLIGLPMLFSFITIFSPLLGGLLQLLSLVASIWQIVILVKGVSILHEMSGGKAFLVWLCTVLVFLLIGVIIYLAVSSYIVINPERMFSLNTIDEPGLSDSSGLFSNLSLMCTKTQKWCYDRAAQYGGGNTIPECYTVKEDCSIDSQNCYQKDWWCDSNGGCAESDAYCDSSSVSTVPDITNRDCAKTKKWCYTDDPPFQSLNFCSFKKEDCTDQSQNKNCFQEDWWCNSDKSLCSKEEHICKGE